MKESVFLGFEPNSVMLTGGIICLVMAVMLLFQARSIQGYALILRSLALCLLGGTTALFLAVADSGYNLPIRMNAANIIGTLTYFAAMFALLMLYRPHSRKDIPLGLLFVTVAGFAVYTEPMQCYAWSQTCRIASMVYTAVIVFLARDSDAPGLRWMALSLSVGSVIGMSPQLVFLLQLPADAVKQLVDTSSDASRSQALLWAVSPSLVYACVTSVIYARVSRRLRDSAYIDVLTGAFSRRYLFERGGKMLDEQAPQLPAAACSLLLIDIDHFKSINDTWGHTVGDSVLTHCVSCIKDVVRTSDSIVGRYGGEEFCVLLPNTPLSTASSIAERVRHKVAETPYQHGEQTIPITVSIGIALQNVEATIVGMLEVADQRLYQAKQSGRNRVIHQDAFAPVAA